MSSMLSMQNVTKIYPGKGSIKAVDNLSLELNQGEICVLVGPSGCGKTTCMKMINRLIPMTSGKIEIHGQNIDNMDTITLRRNIGYVIQNVGLFPNMTIAENIAVIPKMKGWHKDKIKKKTRMLLETINLPPDEYMSRYPRELSGGQQQRIGVARAMAADPPVMLMDEPFGAIDPINREHLQDEFLKIQENVKKTIVFVTHDIDEAIKMGDKICLMNAGKQIQFDTPETLLTCPANDFVKNFVGSDRALKRLSLHQVHEVMHYEESVIDWNRSLESAIKKMESNQLDYLAVVDKQHCFTGYVSRKHAKTLNSSLTGAVIHPKAFVYPNTNLKEALSMLYACQELDTIAVVDDKHQVNGFLNEMDIKKILNK